MSVSVSPKSAERADVIVRGLRESDLSLADSILRCAFDTFTGVTSLFGDKDYVHTRWLADPGAAFAAEQDGQLAGTNFMTRWGTVGFFGPLSVRPDLWDRGVASRLLEATVALFDRWGTVHAGLFTFAHSPKHHGLYLPKVRVLATFPDPGADQGADRQTTVAPGTPLHRASGGREGPSP